MVYELVSNPRLNNSWLVRSFPLLMNITLMLAIILNILAIKYDDGEEDLQVDVNADPLASLEDRNDKPRIAIIALGIVQIVFSVFRLLSYAVSHIPLVIYQQASQQAEEAKSNIRFSVLGSLSENRRSREQTDVAQSWSVLEWIFFSVVFLFDGMTLYHLLYVVVAIAGVVADLPVLFAFFFMGEE